MKAIVQYKYGPPDVLELLEADKPEVGHDDVLVRVEAVSVNPYDWHMMRGKPYLVRSQAGLLKPKAKIQGADMAGRIEEVGKNVTQFRAGDEVFGEVKQSFAEYVCVPADRIALKPTNLSFEQAAAVPLAGLTALQGIRDKGRTERGHKVLINGASGGVGTFAVQIAKSFGAVVTAVCSTANLEMVRSIGADHVIDYATEDFTTNGRRYDVIFDLVGTQSLRSYRGALTTNGVYVMCGAIGMGDWIGPLTGILKVLLSSVFRSQTMTPMLAKVEQADLVVLKELVEAGEITPVIDRTYPLSELSEAMRYLEEGHAKGKVVVTVPR